MSHPRWRHQMDLWLFSKLFKIFLLQLLTSEMDDLYILLTPFWQMTVQCLVCRSVRHCLGSGSWGTCRLLKVMESLMQQLWKRRFSLVVVGAGGFVLVPLRPLWWWRNLSSWEVTLKVSCKRKFSQNYWRWYNCFIVQTSFTSWQIFNSV